MEPTADRKFEKWTAPEIPLSVEYFLALMEEIRAAVLKGPQEREIGGVLFGTRQDANVRVAAWRPIRCEHADGPAFDLSSDDRRDLLRLLLAARSDPELRELRPVGWFVSHSSGDLALHHRDITLGNDFFTEPWQVTLVLVPSGRAGALRARFFARDAEGSLRTEPGSPDFLIEPLARPSIRWNWARDWARVAPYLPWAIAAVLTVILAGVWMTPSRAPQPLAAFALSIEDAGSAYDVVWDTSSAAIRDASRAEIQLQDGNQATQVTLDATQLRQGKLRRQRGTSDVQVRMKVYAAHGGEVQEFARLTIKTVGAAAAAPAAVQQSSPAKMKMSRAATPSPKGKN